jgi:RNA polymerase sigma-70 factor (ECF subfamily)
METGAPDENLMQLVAQGDLDAFGQLVLRHQETAWRTSYRLVADYQAAEDIAQEAFLKILQAADRYRPTAAFRTYLYRVVIRLCLDYLRKGRPVPTDNLLPADDGASPGQRTAHAEQTEAVQEAIGCLPPKQRTAIVLRYYEGLAGREIAAAMETSVKAVERLLARARAKLEGLLADYLKN